jgi:polyhydroxybutyrate depolymerase
MSIRKLCALTVLTLCALHCAPPVSPADSGTDVADGAAIPAMDGASTDAIEPSADAGPMRDPLVIARPFRVRAPETVDPAHPLPMVLLLHGYSVNSNIQDVYFGLSNVVPTRNFVLALPDGTIDSRRNRFWNATEACCNFDGVAVDDVAYLRAVIADVKQRYPIDPAKVFVIGHSNGGFMALRLACELSDQISAVISLAGADRQDASRCRPAQPVHILAVHGTMDETVPYAGAMMGGISIYPGAEGTVANWAMRNGCTGMLTATGAALDLDTGLMGAETTRLAHSGCRPGGSAELWRIVGGAHAPALANNWSTLVMDWFMAHSR